MKLTNAQEKRINSFIETEYHPELWEAIEPYITDGYRAALQDCQPLVEALERTALETESVIIGESAEGHFCEQRPTMAARAATKVLKEFNGE